MKPMGMRLRLLMPEDVVLTRCLAAGWRRVAFIGLTKHAGKTTALNGFITAAEEAGQRLGLCSIGLDGERLDTLLGVEKPAVYAPAGTIVASAEKALEQSHAQLEWLEELPIHSPLGTVMLVRVTDPGDILLAGVRQRQHVELVMARLAAYGVDFSLVDGAFDRVAAAAPNLVDAAVVAIGATAGKTASEVAKLAAAFFRRFQLPEVPQEWRQKLEPAHDAGDIGVWADDRLQLLPAHQSVLGLGNILGTDSGLTPGAGSGLNSGLSQEPKADYGPRPGRAQAIYLAGALTDGVCQQLAGLATAVSPLQVVVAHPAQVQASEAALRQVFRAGHRVSVWRSLPIAGVAVNPHNILGYDLPWRLLAAELAQVAPGLVFYDALGGQHLTPGTTLVDGGNERE